MGMVTITINITVKRTLRVKIGVWLIVFGAWLAGISRVEQIEQIAQFGETASG